MSLTPHAPRWLDHAIFWQVYPLGFSGAPIRERDAYPQDRSGETVHRLRHLVEWLDYARDLGANGILLGPIFESSTHGYDTTDYLRIDRRLGDDDDFDALVTACRQHGFRLLLDGVFNHVGTEHPRYRRVLAEGPDSPDAGLFRLDWRDGHARPHTFEGHGGLATLNHDNPAVADLVVEVMTHWLRRGIDGWRLDAAYAVNPDFWRPVIERVRAEFPDAAFVGEVIHGDYPDIVARSGMDSVTEYELWKATWSSLKDRNLFELDWALTRHNEFARTFRPQTFIGNHDVTRVATLVGHRQAILAAVVLMTVAGMPSLYYGDEQGFEAVKEERWGGDDAIRPAYPATPADLPTRGWPTYHRYQELIGIRRRHPWLADARTRTTTLTNTRIAYRCEGAAGERLDVEIDLDGAPSATIRLGADVLFSYRG